MNASDAWREVATRKISVTPALGQWIAEVWINSDRDHNRKRPVRAVNATASTPIAAVAALCAKLDREHEQQELELVA